MCRTPYAIIGGVVTLSCFAVSTGTINSMYPENDVSEADRDVRSIKIFTFFVFAILGVWAPYLGLYYYEQGLTGTEIGILSAMIPLSVIVLPPVWGYVSDRARDPRRVMATCIGVAGVALFPCAFGDTFLFYLPFILVFSFFICPMVPLNDAQIFAGIAEYGGDYGRIRFWGSMGFDCTLAVLSLIFFFAPYIHAIFVVWCVVIPLALWNLRKIPRLPSRLQRGQYFRGLRLLRNRQFVVFIGGIFFNRVTIISLYVFQSIYLRKLDVPLYGIGLIWALGPLSELFFFMYSDRFSHRLGVKGLLVISQIAVVLRLGILSAAPPLWIIILSQLLHSLTFGANHLGAVTFVNDSLPPQLRSSGQTILAATAVGFGTAVGCTASGYLFDVVGIFVTFAIAAMVAAVGLCFLLIAFHPEEKIRANSDVLA